MAVGAVGAIMGGKKAFGDKDSRVDLGSFKFTYVDVYDQNNLKEPVHLPVPAAFLPNLKSRGKKANLMQDKEAGCRWLSRALQKKVTAIYLQSYCDDSWQLFLFPLQDGSPPFQEGAVVVVCCDGQALQPEVTKDLPLKRLEETKRRGVFDWINKTVASFSTSLDKSKASSASKMTTHVADVRKSLSELIVEKGDTSATREQIQLDETLLAAARGEGIGEETHEDDGLRRSDRKASFRKITKNLTNLATLIEQHGSSFMSEASHSDGSSPAIEDAESISLHLRALAATLEVEALVSDDESVEPTRASSKDYSKVAAFDTLPPNVPPPAATATNRKDIPFCFLGVCNSDGCESRTQEDDEELGDVKRHI